MASRASKSARNTKTTRVEEMIVEKDLRGPTARSKSLASPINPNFNTVAGYAEKLKAKGIGLIMYADDGIMFSHEPFEVDDPPPPKFNKEKSLLRSQPD